MDFINKLIKRGIFGLLLIFSFFVFSNGIKVEGLTCDTPVLNDGDKYLVLNVYSAWKDSGVTVTCGGTNKKDVMVQVNNDKPVQATNGIGVVDNYVKSPGFYKIKYYVVGTGGEELASIIRQIRVLPANLNEGNTIWASETDKINTANNDVFNKIIYANVKEDLKGYLAVGNFDSVGYLVGFNARGEYLWHSQVGEVDTGSNSPEITDVKINDIVMKDEEGLVYYLAGQYKKKDAGNIGFVKSIQLNTDGEIASGIGATFEMYDGSAEENERIKMTSVNKIVLSSNYLVATGYKLNASSMENGVIARVLLQGLSLSSGSYYKNNEESRYNSVLSFIESGVDKVIAVGNTSVNGALGATGGLVTVCATDSFDCINQNPYLYRNDNLASTTITTFKDVVSHGTKFIVVGESRIDKVNGSTISTNAGVEDALFVLLDEGFSIVDVQLRGSSSQDLISSIKLVPTTDNNYIAVGKRAGQGYYVEILVQENKFQISEKMISGNIGLELNDVAIIKTSNGEMHYVFAGKTQSVKISDIIVENKGNEDASMLILDETSFSNYETIKVTKNTVMCADEVSFSCNGNLVVEDYMLIYGNNNDAKKVAFPAETVISSETIGSFNVYHADGVNDGFVNSQKIKFKIGRIIEVTDNPKAPDLVTGEMGIDRWYLYSRPQIVGNNVAGHSRLPLWNEYYYPVDNYIEKTSGETYYKLTNDGTFIEDTSLSQYTYANYIKMPEEPQNTAVAFQSPERVKEKDTGFAILQEFTRIAVVNRKFDSLTTGITAFQGEIASLSVQNYYFVYYIDLQVGENKNATCGTVNGTINGNCTNYTGYAFAGLERIKTLANMIVEKNNYFVSESTNRYNPDGNVGLPSLTGGFREEMTTSKYVRNISVSLKQTDLYLVVSFKEAVNGVLNSTPVISYITGRKGDVIFRDDGDYTKEGEYTVKYCYNYQVVGKEHCGKDVTFVIDRSAPLISYSLSVGEKGSVLWMGDRYNPTMLKGEMKVESIVDIDPYAYTIVDGKKYYLTCNQDVNDPTCASDRLKHVMKEFVYDPLDPNKINEMHVYDRAGNYIDFYFVIGTVMPSIDIEKESSGESFVFIVEFFEKNTIDSFIVEYMPSEVCNDPKLCTNPETIKEAILRYVNALTYINNQELLKAKNDPTYDPKPNIQESIKLTFTISIPQADDSISGGVNIPEVEYDIETGEYIIKDNVLYPISKGLYNFILADKFENIDNENYAGLGLSQAELDVYIEDDVDYEDDVNNTKIPKTQDEVGDQVDKTAIFIAKEPETYQYLDKLPNTSLQNGLDKSMYFTNKFIYVKFKENQFGVLEIYRATAINNVNNFTSKECLITIYGINVDLNRLKNNTCGDDKRIPLGSINNEKDYLEENGIYIVGTLGEYYYLAFANEGTYSVTSSVYAKQTSSGETAFEVALPETKTFTIDKTGPTITYDFICEKEKGSCKADQDIYQLSDFVGNDRVVNIGNYNFRLKINKDLLYKDATTSVENRLLMVRRNNEVHNAYVYFKDNAFIEAEYGAMGNYGTIVNLDGGLGEIEEGLTEEQYMIFTASGTYEITFFDSVGNEITFKFSIDETIPQISMSDPDGIGFSDYRQYADVKITITEDTFLKDKTDRNPLTIVYTLDGNEQSIEITNNSGQCDMGGAGSGLIQSGSGKCEVIENNGVSGISVSFIININKEERKSGTATLTVIVKDYFGNSDMKQQGFDFDNSKPYIYFDAQYTPIKQFGEGVSNQDREKMLTVGADTSLGSFSCENLGVLNGKIICKDTPEKSGKNNNVVVEAYEAYKAAYNNYTYEKGKYVSIPDGEYVDVNTIIYTRNYTQVESLVGLQNLVNSNSDIYTAYTPVKLYDAFYETKELIDPNTIYYYDNSGVKAQVDIRGMYTDASFATYANYNNIGMCGNNAQCVLYKMYQEYGYFVETTINFYKNQISEGSKVHYTQADTSNIDFSNPTKYYSHIANDYSEDKNFTDNYLKALTLENSCVKANGGQCISVAKDRVKLLDYGQNKFTYYAQITKARTNNASISQSISGNTRYVSVVNVGGTDYDMILDDTIYRVAQDASGKLIKFGFSLPSELGRPIIFKAQDGATNEAVNYLETVIIIKDNTTPAVNEIVSVKYEQINKEDATSIDYAKVAKYYKVHNVNNVSCVDTDTKYYRYNKTQSKYELVTCGDFNQDEDFYAEVYEYELYDANETYPEYTKYYRAVVGDLKDNYITTDNYIISFNEPLFRVECSYYLYDSKTGETIEKKCIYDNTEYNYRDEKTTFKLVYEEDGREDYYVNFKITVYDFSNNSKSVNYLFIDRDTPTINFHSDSNAMDRLEANYLTGSIESKYNSSYIRGQYRDDIYVQDNIDTRVSAVGATSHVNNPLDVTVTFYKFNYNIITSNNYIFKDNKYVKVEDAKVGTEKDPNTTYYILIKNTGEYVLKGNSRYNTLYNTAVESDYADIRDYYNAISCKVGDYCYIEDSYNYYPHLLEDSRYWTPLEAGHAILNNEIGVYKIHYQVKDYCQNTSGIIIKTIYITDTQGPVLLVNGGASSQTYGYHRSVTISFENEKQAAYNDYTCVDSSLICVLPSSIFPVIDSSINASDTAYTQDGRYAKTYSQPGIYKVFFYDLGNYQEETAYDSDLGQEIQVMSLKYNYNSYQFIIDTTPPQFFVSAVIENEKLHYEVTLSQDDNTYCVVGSRNNSGELSFSSSRTGCAEYLTGTPETKVNADQSEYRYLIYNHRGEIIYEKIYSKVSLTAPKYFYKSYYYNDGSNFREYGIGAELDINNLYEVTAVKMYFREDGRYLIQAEDRAGNIAGRTTIGQNFEGSAFVNSDRNKVYSEFVIDNTVPTYNKSQNMPTGINYWFSVPSAVINNDNMNSVKSITKGSNSYYNVFDSNLNSPFFYAFATKAEAISYLTTIYAKHINAQSDNTCNGNGFNYSYYDPTTGAMKTSCFEATHEKPSKAVALDVVSATFDKLIFNTFSGNVLFGDGSIRQLACDETVSSDCATNRDMYKYVYLKVENNTTYTVTETCVASATVECIKINVKIIKNVDNSNTVDIKLGSDNLTDPDSYSVAVYYGSGAGDTSSVQGSPFTSSKTVSLNNKSYYVFVEKDTEIKYTNYVPTQREVSKYNVTYYAVYVDGNEKLEVYYEDDEGKNENNQINSDGWGNGITNHDKYDLILESKNNHEDFVKKYEIHELWNNGNLLEVYSYLRLCIGGVYYNINDYLIKEGNNYYFRIPLVNTNIDGLKERIVTVELYDRAGNATFYKLSHTQKAPEINLAWASDNSTIEINITENTISKIATDNYNKKKVKVYYSKSGDVYSEILAKNVRDALVCENMFTGYISECFGKDGAGRYRLILSNIEHLYGFFKLELEDDHGNANSIEFIYNPANLSANYTTANTKYIGYDKDSENVRMISNSHVQLEWNNEWNYIILYKVDNGSLVEVCNSKDMGISNNVLCAVDGNSYNIVKVVHDDKGYVKSVLNYVDEGTYEAKIFNRQSIIINSRCIDENGNVKEDCKPMKTHSSNICSWNTSPEYCAKALEILTQVIVQSAGGQLYTRFEIDKTPPSIDTSKFHINLPTGSEDFVNNGVYTNAEVTVKWDEKLVQLTYTCEYVDDGITEICGGNSTGFSINEYKFSVRNRLSTRYTFWFEDYSGNTTEDNKLSFTINVVLPDFEVFEMDSNGQIFSDKLIQNEQKIKNNAKLICYVDNKVTDCSIYDVKLYRQSASGFNLVTQNDVTSVSENHENTYKYVVSIKSLVNGDVFESLSKEIMFTIDKVAPNITVEGNKEQLWGIYRGEVRILIDSKATGTIYSGCVATGVDEFGDKTYDCKNTLVESFTSNYTLNQTGIYKVVAVDEIGNVTIGKGIKYITIDNTNPDMEIFAETTYIKYPMSENGFTNAEKVVIKSTDKHDDFDNSEESYIMYRKKNADGTYGEWITHNGNVLEISEEGFYEVKNIDIVGNQGLERHFIIYRQTPKFYMYVGNNPTPSTENDIIRETVQITWDEPKSELEAPIIKVTMNGRPYEKNTKIENTGEYMFVFIDLAGNSVTHKVTINKSEQICLNNILLTPNKQYLFSSDNIKFSGGRGYTFKEDDVLVLATLTHYYGVNSTCGENIFSYKTLSNDELSYLILNKSTADHINKNQNVKMTLSAESKKIVDDLGGYVYIFVVDKEVATKDLGFEIGENFFTKDPLGWTMVFVAGIGLIYLGFKIFVFKKKVKVLK